LERHVGDGKLTGNAYARRGRHAHCPRTKIRRPTSRGMGLRPKTIHIGRLPSLISLRMNACFNNASREKRAKALDDRRGINAARQRTRSKRGYRIRLGRTKGPAAWREPHWHSVCNSFLSTRACLTQCRAIADDSSRSPTSIAAAASNVKLATNLTTDFCWHTGTGSLL